MNWKTREIVTLLFLHGKSLEEVGFPDEWEYDPVLCIWEKDGYDSTDGKTGIKKRNQFCLSAQKLYSLKKH